MQHKEYFHETENGMIKVQRTDTLWLYFKQVKYGDDYKPWIKVGFNAIEGCESSKTALDRFLASQPKLFL